MTIILQATGTGTYVVPFRDFTPSPRDDQPWISVQVEEAPTKDGPWTVLASAALDPVDTDPEVPQPRDFTLTGATLAAGWYRITFFDADGNQTPPSRPIWNGANITPSLAQVADLLRTYVKDDVGEVAEFNANTRPTAEQVERYIGHGLRRVRAKLGPIYLAAGDYEELADDATHAVALYAAAMAVLARTPEQQSGTNSHYSNLKELFDEALADLDKAAEEISDGGEIGSADASAPALGIFPEPSVRWDCEAF